MPSSDPLGNVPEQLRRKYEQAIGEIADKGVAAHGVIAQMRTESITKEAVEAAEVVLRIAAGLDVSGIHGKDTPARFVQMLRELTTPPDIKWKTFENEGYDEMIIERGIPFTSLCNHHVIPFIGVAHVGYVPKDTVPGLSKIARVVQHYSHGLQIQEKLTKDIADFLESQLEPRGVAVVLEAEHMCMTIRGAQVPGTLTYTAAMRGVFSDHERTAKAEFLSRLNGGHK